jgi:hypothetical protein
MKFNLGLVAALSIASDVSAHYIFNQIEIAGKKYGVYEGIRENTNYNSPVTDLASNDLICNVGGFTGESTKVLPAKAGDSFTFTTDTAVYHNGPVSLFLSKAKGAIEKYSGQEGWVKIKDWGPTFNGGSTSWPLRQTYTYNIPQCIPNGLYLLRVQSLGIHNPYPSGLPQFYVSCAQLNITGGAGSVVSWKQDLKIPGAFKATDSGYVANIYNPSFTTYDTPAGTPMTC